MKREPEIYLISLIHLVGTLKEEIADNFPAWNFSKGANGFVTYRLDRDYPLEELYDFPITFTLVKGLVLDRGELGYIESRLADAQKEFETEVVHRWDLVEESGVMGDRKARGPVIDIIRVGDEEYVLGVRQQVRGDFAPFEGSTPIPTHERAPSLAYYKVGEAFKRFRPLVGHEEVFLDIGCAPGGSSYYLLNKGFRVIGVDPEPIKPEVNEDFPEGFLPLNTTYSNLKIKHLKGLPPVNWIILDVDMPPLEALEGVLKLADKLEECVGIIFMVKLDYDFSIQQVREIEELARDHEFVDIRKSILPSHDREFCLFLTKAE